MNVQVKFVLSVFALAFGAGLACQDYPFETRASVRVDGRKISEVIGAEKPVDILFVLDNSGSMTEENEALASNLRSFVQELLASNADFQVGIVTPDVSCNIPERDCDASPNSSYACCARALPACVDTVDGEGKVISSTCDGGRLREASSTGRRIFPRPAPGDEEAWADEVASVVSSIDCEGSAYEAAFEAMRRAIACSVPGGSCPSTAIRDLNTGFVREGADLVIIFVSDEDDCSSADVSIYNRPPDPSFIADQGQHLCSPRECYAFYNAANDSGGISGLDDWSDLNPNPRYFSCGQSGGSPRSINPPSLSTPSSYLDEIIALKGSVATVRAAGIIGSIADLSAPLGQRAAACTEGGAGGSSACGCWSILGDNGLSGEFYCELTGLVGQQSTALPARGSAQTSCSGGQLLPNAGCLALPSSRYVEFLELLAERRIAASRSPDTLVNTICQSNYAETLRDIVFNVIISNCLALGVEPSDPDSIVVQRNGEALSRVDVGSERSGFSYVAGATEICLEGGVEKNLSDEFEIFVLDASP